MIERSPHRERFTRIDNHAIESRALSMQALGLLAYLLSRPDDWNPERVQLAGQFTNGRDAVAAALRELEAAGHLTRRRERGEAGRWEWKRVVHELPVPAEQHTSVQEPHSGATSDDAVKPQVAASDGIPVSGSIDGKSVSGATSGNNAKPQVGSIDGISVDGKSVDVVTTEGATTETTTERRLCDLLADEIARNTGRRPKVGKRWLDAARLLLDRDKRTVEQVTYLIRWSQANEFWRANILSMPKLREKWDTLALQAKAQHNGRRGAGPAPVPLVDPDEARRRAIEQNERERERLAAARTTRGATP